MCKKKDNKTQRVGKNSSVQQFAAYKITVESSVVSDEIRKALNELPEPEKESTFNNNANKK